jgi:hypothetical protein
MLPKLKEFRREDTPMSFGEFSVASKNLVSLTCINGFDFNSAHVDMSSLIFTRLKKVKVESENDYDLQFIVNVLENSIPKGRGFLKSLDLIVTSSNSPVNSTVNYAQVIPLLSKVIEVRFYSNEYASPGMSDLQLIFNNEHLNLDSCLDSIFGLDQITSLLLLWNRMSLDKIKSVLRKQGGKKRWEIVCVGEVNQAINDSDILEICSYLPSLIEWSVFPPRSSLTVDGAREWKRICPNLENVHFAGGEVLSDQVKDVLQDLGVTVE